MKHLTAISLLSLTMMAFIVTTALGQSKKAYEEQEFEIANLKVKGNQLNHDDLGIVVEFECKTKYYGDQLNEKYAPYFFYLSLHTESGKEIYDIGRKELEYHNYSVFSHQAQKEALTNKTVKGRKVVSLFIPYNKIKSESGNYKAEIVLNATNGTFTTYFNKLASKKFNLSLPKNYFCTITIDKLEFADGYDASQVSREVWLFRGDQIEKISFRDNKASFIGHADEKYSVWIGEYLGKKFIKKGGINELSNHSLVIADKDESKKLPPAKYDHVKNIELHIDQKSSLPTLEVNNVKTEENVSYKGVPGAKLIVDYEITGGTEKRTEIKPFVGSELMKPSNSDRYPHFFPYGNDITIEENRAYVSSSKGSFSVFIPGYEILNGYIGAEFLINNHEVGRAWSPRKSITSETVPVSVSAEIKKAEVFSVHGVEIDLTFDVPEMFKEKYDADKLVSEIKLMNEDKVVTNNFVRYINKIYENVYFRADQEKNDNESIKIKGNELKLFVPSYKIANWSSPGELTIKGASTVFYFKGDINQKIMVDKETIDADSMKVNLVSAKLVKNARNKSLYWSMSINNDMIYESEAIKGNGKIHTNENPAAKALLGRTDKVKISCYTKVEYIKEGETVVSNSKKGSWTYTVEQFSKMQSRFELKNAGNKFVFSKP